MVFFSIQFSVSIRPFCSANMIIFLMCLSCSPLGMGEFDKEPMMGVDDKSNLGIDVSCCVHEGLGVHGVVGGVGLFRCLLCSSVILFIT